MDNKSICIKNRIIIQSKIFGGDVTLDVFVRDDRSIMIVFKHTRPASIKKFIDLLNIDPVIKKYPYEILSVNHTMPHIFSCKSFLIDYFGCDTSDEFAIHEINTNNLGYWDSEFLATPCASDGYSSGFNI